MTDKRYYIWLQLCLGQGARFLPITEEYGSVEALYNANVLEWKMNPLLTVKQVEALCRYSLEDAETIIRTCNQKGYQIITYDDAAYPACFRNIPNPPAIFHVDGTLPDFEKYAVIGMVGTRKASGYGIKAANAMAKGMAQCGAIIVSGGALGVDSAAHIGAMAGGGRTYAVLGCGFDAPYLKSNAALRKEIKRAGGALISEYPPHVNAAAYNFPMRNRLISALADGVLVVEAGIKSGSLITAGHALEQGKDVFAIPASVFDKNFQGSNKLIDDGAYVATSPYTVLSHYAEKYDTLDLSKVKTPYELLTADKKSANAEEKKQVTFDTVMQDRAQRVSRTKTALMLEGDEKTVYEALSEHYRSIDELIEACHIAPQKVLVCLTMLEMKGLIESASGKRYRLQ